jgi:aminopeptidase 2
MCRGHDAVEDVHTTGADITKGREILPANVKATHYHVTLEPNLETFEYEGEVVIQ